jgi:hypothetical protein
MIFGKGKGNSIFHFSNILLLFTSHQLFFITIQIKKSLPNIFFFIFSYQTFFFFFFHINQFFLQYQIKTETKSFTKRTLGIDWLVTATWPYQAFVGPKIFVVMIKI